MKCFPLLLYLTALLESVLTSLPAPVHLSMESNNFNHKLTWDPGPGTLPGTHYKVYIRVNNEIQEHTSRDTSLKLQLNRWKKYYLSVQAIYNQTQSPNSTRFEFTPYSDTKIGRPTLSLAGCGDCIRMNITLPEPDRSLESEDLHEFYHPTYEVFWKKRNEAVTTVKTLDRSFTLQNLEKGVEYCVQVNVKTSLNENTEPTDWGCTFTSILEPSLGPVILGTVAALVLLISAALMASILCLYYTGFIGKQKAALPKALMGSFILRCTMNPETTMPDKVYISPDAEKQKSCVMLPPANDGIYSAEEDENEDEDEGSNNYMDRAAELSSGASHCQGPSDASGNGVSNSAGDSVSWESEVSDVKVRLTHGDLGQDKAQAEESEVSFLTEEGQTGAKGHSSGEVEEEEEKGEEMFHSSGNINLLSVTLATLADYEESEEEEDRQNTTDFWNAPDLEPLLHTDAQSEFSDPTAVADRLQSQDTTGYEGCRGHTQSDYLKSCVGETHDAEPQEEEGEEEEEEKFSGYMSHR